MTTNNTNDDDAEKYTGAEAPEHVERHAETLRATADELAGCMTDLADAVERGDADADLVDDTIRKLAAAYVPIEDTADVAGVIDAGRSKYRTMNMARRVLYRSTAHDPKRAAEDARETVQHAETVRDGE